VPLSLALDRVILTRPCPKCGHQLKKQGVWFKAVGQYICEECRLFIVMTYPEKGGAFRGSRSPDPQGTIAPGELGF